MRLRRLDLKRYGKFTDRLIDFGALLPGEPDLHVVYGLNEAGKSTALSAYLDLLFGIEERTRYGFLHTNAAMEVGACLEFDGLNHEFARRKQRSGSLVDGSGRVADESILVGALSGLTRDAYRTMFSLDDETLERGGDAILQSKGDLGELLFSANAGLSEIGAVLARVSDEASGIYGKGKRTTEIALLKQDLRSLKEQREAIDMAASTYVGLAKASSNAAEVYANAVRELGGVRARLERAERIVRVRPLADEYSRLTHDLGRLTHLPRPPADWACELPGLLTADSRLATLAQGADETIARLSHEIDEIVVDDQLLSLADEIRGLGDALGRFTAAEDDLPRRRVALGGHDATVAGLLAALGRVGDGDPAMLVPPAAIVGTLRELVESRSGIDAVLRTAEREAAEAKDALSTLRDDLARLAGGGAVEDIHLQNLRMVLGRVRGGDVQVALRQAERDVVRQERLVAEAFEALAPWTGDQRELRALDLPDMRRVEAWRSRSAAIEVRRTGHRGRLRELASALEEGEARLEMLRRAAGPLDDEEARRLRATRDAAWARHRVVLDADSAASFEVTMVADDRIVENRLARTMNLAELLGETSKHENDRRSARREGRHLAEAEGDASLLLAEIGDAVRIELGNIEDEPVDGRLDRLANWCRRADHALSMAMQLGEANHRLAASRADFDRARGKLAEALGRCGMSIGADADLPDLLAAAETTLSHEAEERAGRIAAERGVAEAERTLATRQRDLKGASSSAADWEQRWGTALTATCIGPDLPVAAVRETLTVLDKLPGALRERDEMRRRIETMERDRRVFADRLAGLCDRLGRTLDATSAPQAARELAGELERAERAADGRTAKTAELGRVRDVRRRHEQELRAHERRKGELVSFFEVETLPEVVAACASCAERDRFEARLVDIEEILKTELRTASLPDALAELRGANSEAADKDVAELSALRDDLDERRQSLFVDMTRHADALAAVGGDAAAARLQTERRTTLLRIEDAALRHLRLRAGALVAQEALRIYRDKHQGPMMRRASQAFAAMTRGDYTGLTSRSDKDRETLIGVSRSGGSKLAGDMSKGTRFQLYLALRLAGYAEFAASRRAVPFVADDIMETFDEPRSTEVLRLLAETAKVGQVVYLTHHRHICDLARTVAPSVAVHEI